jgi:hypothetical protein
MFQNQMFPDDFERILICRWVTVETHMDTSWNRTMVQLGLKKEMIFDSRKKKHDETVDADHDDKYKKPMARDFNRSKVPAPPPEPSAIEMLGLGKLAEVRFCIKCWQCHGCEIYLLFIHLSFIYLFIYSSEQATGCDSYLKCCNMCQFTQSVIPGMKSDSATPVTTTTGSAPGKSASAVDNKAAPVTRPPEFGHPQPRQRLLAITNMALYMFDAPIGTACNVCDPSEFCPTGPTLVGRREFRMTMKVVLHPSSQRLRVWFNEKTDEGERTERIVTYSTMDIDVLDAAAGFLCDFYPLQNAVDKPRVLEDEYTLEVIKANLKSTKERAAQSGDVKALIARALNSNKNASMEEKIMGCIVCWDSSSKKGATRAFGREDEQVVVVTSRFVDLFFY